MLARAIAAAALVAVPLRAAAAAEKVRPPPPPPDVKFTIVAPTTTRGWVLRLVNGGDVPVRVLADERLVSLEVTPRSARRSLHCELPPSMRPADVLERAMVLPPGRAFYERFEPRLYCFGPRGFDALAPGAIVVARMGPRGASSRTAPEVSPIDGVSPVVAPVPVLRAPPIALPDEKTEGRRRGEEAKPDFALDLPRLKLVSPAAVDAASPEEIDLPVTLQNEGLTPVTVRFRPETIGFEVTSSTSVQRCVSPVRPSAPTPELFTTLAPRGSTTLTVVLRSYCADPFFLRSGLLAVRPFLETRGASGAPLGLRTFDGRVVASSVTYVRLQRGSTTEPLVRPVPSDPW